MYLKASLIAVAFALVTLANSVAQPEAEGFRIPLEKRSRLTRVDGTVDYEKAIHYNSIVHK